MARHTAKSHKIRKVEILVIQIQICGFPKLDAGGRRPLGRFGRLPVHPGGQHAHREFPALLRRPLRGDPV